MLRRVSVPATGLLLGVVLACPIAAIAQHHGHGGAGVPGGAGRPDGVDEKDTLKDFHQAMAVQATGEQITEFQALVKATETARTSLQAFAQKRGNPSTSSAAVVGGAEIDQSLETARADSKKFVGGFSDTQKSGLKEITRRLDKADSDLEQEEKKLDQSVQAKATDVSAQTESLTKALTDFSNQQLALGREMGVVLASGDDVTFNLATVKSPVNIGNRTVGVNVSGALSQVAVEGSQRTFKLQMIANLSDLQQNIAEILRAQLGPGRSCGERLAVRQATIASSSPASVLVLQLHYERWSCIRPYGQSGQSTSNELAEGEGTVEIKLTPSVDKSNSLKLAAEFSRIDANGMMGEALRSGDLGDELREKVAQSVLSAAQAGMDFKTTLPPAVQNSAVAQSAKFQDTGAGELSVLIDGQLAVSNDQVNLMASQLNQILAAQGTASR